MKTLWTVISVLAVLHMLALVGAVGWLASSGRLSDERVKEMVALFTPTVDEETKAAEEAKKAEDLKMEVRPIDVSLVKSAAKKNEDDRKEQALTLRQLERTQQEIKQLQNNLQLAQITVLRERKEYEEAKKALEDKIVLIEKEKNDAGFKKVIALYESLPAKTVKPLMIEMIKAGDEGKVVAYLEALDERKAAGILKEFKSAEEVQYVVNLSERLRARGSDLVAATENGS